MKIDRVSGFFRKAAAGAVVFVLAGPLAAFPPAPHHTIKGVVRDQFGNPLTGEAANVILEPGSGIALSTPVQADLQPGVNYRFEVPIDAGLAPGSYKRNALNPQAPFTLKVTIGSTIYLPLEMTGSLASLGEPGGLTVINLTLGVDSDGDGIPDAWEETLIQSGVDASLASIVDVEPDGDADRDGLSNYTEYIAGTYAFDPNDVFALEILDADQVRYLLRFLAIRGRSYAIESSLSLDVGWEAAEFTLDDGSGNSLARADYYASSVEEVTVRVARNEPENSRFFRLVARQ